MADETSSGGTENVHCLILKGPDGALYLMSEENLQAHRLPDDVAAPLRAAYESQGPKESGSTLGPPTMSFQILGQGPVVRRRGSTVPTMDTWFDMARAPQPGRPGRP